MMKVTSEVDVMVLLGKDLNKHLTFETRGNIVYATPKRRLPSTVYNEIARKIREMHGQWKYGAFQIPLKEEP